MHQRLGNNRIAHLPVMLVHCLQVLLVRYNLLDSSAHLAVVGLQDGVAVGNEVTPGKLLAAPAATLPGRGHRVAPEPLMGAKE